MSDVLVLCYHAVSDHWRAALSVRPDRLAEQLRYLLGRGYVGATFSQAVQSPSAPLTLAVTFDDAYRSVAELARPILDELGLPGTVFVPTAYAGTEQPMSWPGIDHWVGGAHHRELWPMSWSELHELGESGWEIGSHTRTHPHLTSLDDGELARELRGSKEDVERALGLACPAIAYPYGDVDRRVVEAAGRAGYRTGAALPGSLRRVEPLLWPRVGVYHDDSQRRFERHTARPVRWLAASPAWPLIERGARAVRSAQRALGRSA